MTFNQPAFDFDLTCFPPPIEVQRELPSFANSGTDQGFVAGEALYERANESVRFSVFPAPQGVVDEMIYFYRLSGAGTVWMWLRIPGDREPVEARFSGPLEIQKLDADAAFRVALELEVRV